MVYRRGMQALVAGIALVAPLMLAAPSQAATGKVDVVAGVNWVRSPDWHICAVSVMDEATDPYCFKEQSVQPRRPNGDTFLDVSATRRGKPVRGGTVKVQLKFYINRLECGLKVGADGWVRQVCEPWRSRGGTLTQTVQLDANGQAHLPMVCTDNLAARISWPHDRVNADGVANGYKVKGTVYNAKGKRLGVDSDPYVQPRMDGRVCFAAWPA